MDVQLTLTMTYFLMYWGFFALVCVVVIKKYN